MEQEPGGQDTRSALMELAGSVTDVLDEAKAIASRLSGEGIWTDSVVGCLSVSTCTHRI